MSYTLRGRLESRLAAAALPFAAALVLAGALGAWWPLELAGLMVVVGLALDVAVYHRAFPYQPGWAALPLGLVEVSLVTALAVSLGVAAPLAAALAFFAASWAWAQALAHGGFPLLHLTYAEDGGELGRAGTLVSLAAPTAALLVAGVAWTTQPPLVRLAAGVHDGPLVLDRAQRLVGEPGAVVRGGIVITADDVTVRDVHVTDAAVGIDVRDSVDVVLERVTVTGASEDGIAARRSAVTIRDCLVHSLADERAQGIDISFGMHAGHSLVERCTVVGGMEGITTHLAGAHLRRNRVSSTTLRAISMTEMSMGDVVGNVVSDALGVAIFCGDYSVCDVRRNVVRATRPDPDGGRSRAGYAIQAHYGASVLMEDNRLAADAGGVAAFINAEVLED